MAKTKGGRKPYQTVQDAKALNDYWESVGQGRHERRNEGHGRQLPLKDEPLDQHSRANKAMRMSRFLAPEQIETKEAKPVKKSDSAAKPKKKKGK
ncbi:MAG: hypothetical protein FJ109_14165 [Deltaproteobacteria bacterium]|nr:hypothetical protein [Deltaproteobacteria bacterium]